MTTLPTGAQLVAAANVSAMQGLMSDQATAISEMPGGAVATTLTIAAGAVTPTVSCHLVDTEGAAASDDLANIVTTNHPDGRRLLISMVDAARIVTIKHNAGGGGQIALVNSYDLVLQVGGWIELKRIGANWEEVARSQNLISAVQLSGTVNESYVTVASHATTADIWGAKGNVINFTGTATVTAFPAAPQAGVRRRLICAGACSFTNAAGFVVDGGSYTAAAGDVIDIEAVTTSSFKLHPIPVGGYVTKGTDIALSAGKALVFEGATADTYQTTLTAGDPTADRSIVLPNEDGTLISNASLDIDGTLAADSDAKIATQKAVVTYVTAAVSAAASASDILALQQDVMQNYLMNAVFGNWASGQYSNGGYDSFISDTIGASSTNHTYDSINNYYYNPAVAGTDQIPTMTGYTSPSGTVTSSTEYNAPTFAAWKAFDNSPATFFAITGTSGWVAYDWGSARTIGSYSLVGYASGGAGSADSPKDWTFEGWNGSSWITLDTRTNQTAWTINQVRTFTVASPAAYNKYRLNVSANNGTVTYTGVSELRMISANTPPPSMTLLSSALSPAPSTAPTQIKLMVLYSAAGSGAALNTDFTAEATRNGSTWTAGSLSDTGLVISGYNVLWTVVNVSAQSSGTIVKYRLNTLNSKTQQVKGVALMTK